MREVSAVTRAKISAAKMGHHVSLETRAKISASVSQAQRGHLVSQRTRAKIAASQYGTQAHNWKGQRVAYGGAHKRHRAALPPQCAICGTTVGRLDVALRHDTPMDRLLGDVYRQMYFSVHTEDYVRLCRSCHIRYDRGDLALAGT